MDYISEEEGYKLCQIIRYDGTFSPGQTMEMKLQVKLPANVLEKKDKK